jgi:twinkle protein
MLQILQPSDLSQEITSLYQSGLPAGTRTGWDSVDRLYTVSPGKFTVITGIPSHGKSTWVDNLVLNLLKQGWKAIIYSPEQQPPELHLAELAEKWLNRPFRYGYNGRMDSGGLAACVDALEPSLRLLRHDGGSAMPCLQDFQNAVDEISFGDWEKEKIVAVLDPWNELDHSQHTRLTETEMINDRLMRFKMWLRSHQRVHGIIVAHPSKPQKDKNGDYKDVTLYDISGSAAWKNKCDHGIVVRRRDDNVVEIDVEKNKFRHLGKQGIAHLDFYPGTGVYRDQENRIRGARRLPEDANSDS